jgi:hypothetical protein
LGEGADQNFMIPNVPSRQPSKPMPAGHKPRRFGRLRCEMLRCPIGKVEDLSVSGMRVTGKGKAVPVEAEQRMWVILQGIFGELKVKSRVVWTEQTAPRLRDRVRVHRTGRSDAAIAGRGGARVGAIADAGACGL